MKMKCSNRLDVDLDAIRHNVSVLKEKIGEARFCAVVKANAYGLGAVSVSRAIEGDVDQFAVANALEGIELRRAGIIKPIMILGYTPPDAVEMTLDHALTPTIYSLEQAEVFHNTAKAKDRLLSIVIKIDTGLGRLGFQRNKESVEAIKTISKMERIAIIDFFSHFASSDDEDHQFTEIQYQRFEDFLEELSREGIDIGQKHMANDAGYLNHPYAMDMVRSGISLYGYYPSAVVAEVSEVDLVPAARFVTTVVHLKWIEPGDCLSYGRTYCAKERRKIATLSTGYADGYDRGLSNRGQVLIRGKAAPIVGRICMDQMMVDVTDISGVAIGDEATLFGADGDTSLPVETLADLTDTISYEVLTSVGHRVTRRYVQQGKPPFEVNYIVNGIGGMTD